MDVPPQGRPPVTRTRALGAVVGCLIVVGALGFGVHEGFAPQMDLDGAVSETFYIGDQLYLPLTFRVSQGGETVFEKVHGKRTGLAGTVITCSTEPNEFGFAFDVTAVPVPPSR